MIHLIIVQHNGHGTAVFFQEVLAVPLDHKWQLQDLLSVGASLGVHQKQSLDQLAHVHRVVGWDRRVLALQNSFEETVHIVGTEGWHQRAHLVDDTTEGPNVRF